MKISPANLRDANCQPEQLALAEYTSDIQPGVNPYSHGNLFTDRVALGCLRSA